MFLNLLLLHPYELLNFSLYKLLKASIHYHIDTKGKNPDSEYSFLGSLVCVRETVTGFMVYFISHCFIFIQATCMY